jgi:hypothetical protein
MYTPADFLTGNLPSHTQATTHTREAERRSALQKLTLTMNVVDDHERRMGLARRWTENDVEYKKAVEHANNHNFIRTVENLERLVVQWLFELSKANLAGTGVLFNPT